MDMSLGTLTSHLCFPPGRMRATSSITQGFLLLLRWKNDIRLEKQGMWSRAHFFSCLLERAPNFNEFTFPSASPDSKSSTADCNWAGKAG